MTKMNVKNQYVQELITKVIDPVERAGFQCYFVGGCVRDSLMGVTPHDYDLCTDALPIDLHEIFSEFSEKSSEERGVTMPVIELLGKREIVEIATFRKDGATIDGRHTYVEFGGISIDEDAERRDLTINALYADKFGNIIDPTGFGIHDIDYKLIRFVGNAEDRIKEDYLRAFRFCRFVSRFGFTPVYEDWRLYSDSFKNVSKDRQGEEFTKLMMGKCPSFGLEEMMNHHIFDAMGWSDYIDPDMFGVIESIQLLENMDHDWIDVTSVLFHRVRLEIVDRLLRDIRMSNNDKNLILWIISNYKKVFDLHKMIDKYEIWRLISDPRYIHLVRVAKVTDGKEMATKRFNNPLVREVMNKPMPERLVTGDVLLSKGFRHSEEFDFREVLQKAYRNQINLDLKSVDEVLNSIRL